jgi:quinoprotein glucose dehydrogenase
MRSRGVEVDYDDRMRNPKPAHRLAFATLVSSLVSLNGSAETPGPEWPVWGGDAGGMRYSTLEQIRPDNIDQLQLAWEYRTGDVFDSDSARFKQMLTVTPLMVEDNLFLCSARNRVIALDAVSGRERWVHDPGIAEEDALTFACRGVAWWRESGAKGHCAARVYVGTYDARLLALDASTGSPCTDFGVRGEIDLREGLGELETAEYNVTAPPTVAAKAGVLVTGARVADNRKVDAASGVVRAYDLLTGELVWFWNPVPPGESPLDEMGNYVRGTPNAWGTMSYDADRDTVFIPTGNPSPDSFGGLREGLDYYGSSVVALEASTGVVKWHFQTVHNDLWDYDVGAQPTLFTWPGPDGPVPAVVAATKAGMLFFLDRRSGEPLFPVEERRVPAGGVSGETLSPTQPFPTRPHPLADTQLTPDSAWGLLFFDQRACARELRGLRHDGVYTPPSQQGTVQFPGILGGLNWGGVSVDPDRRLMIANHSSLAVVSQLFPRTMTDPEINGMDNGGEMHGSPYRSSLRLLLSPLGIPCNPPPWGKLTALDLGSGERVWERTLGSTAGIGPLRLPVGLPLGAPNLGGSLLTASGLIFIAATTDARIRAFDTDTGETVWSAGLPAGGHATPLSYLGADGRQYVVVAAGGHVALPGRKGDHIQAFALPLTN